MRLFRRLVQQKHLASSSTSLETSLSATFSFQFQTPPKTSSKATLSFQFKNPPRTRLLATLSFYLETPSKINLATTFSQLIIRDSFEDQSSNNVQLPAQDSFEDGCLIWGLWEPESTLVCRDRGCSEHILGDAVTDLDSLNLVETTAKTHFVAEGVGNRAMAAFMKVRKQETAEDAIG